MLPVNFIARRREIRFPLFLLISIIRKYLYFLRNLKDCFNFDFFEYLNLKKKKKKNVIKFDIETITVRPLITPFKKKYHSRNKCSIIDSPIFSFVYSYEHLRRDQSAFDAIRGRIPFRNRLFHGARCCEGDNVNNGSRVACVSVLLWTGETRNRSVTEGRPRRSTSVLEGQSIIGIESSLVVHNSLSINVVNLAIF